MKPAGLILAAGASTRMGRPKATLEIHGETFLNRMVRIFSACCDPVVIVLPPGKEEEWLRGETAHARVAVNPRPERGMLSSLQCGLAALPPGVPVLFSPMDLPSLREETVALIAREAGSAAVVTPVCGGKRGHPVAITAEVAEELMGLNADDGASQAKDALRRDAARIRYVEVADPGAVRDVDDPKDYQELLAAQVNSNNVEAFS